MATPMNKTPCIICGEIVCVIVGARPIHKECKEIESKQGKLF